MVCQKIPIFKVLPSCYWIKLRRTTMQSTITLLPLTNFILIYSHSLKGLSGIVSTLSNSRLLVSMILSQQILLYQQANISINSVLSLIPSNQVLILHATALYIFEEILSKHVEITQFLLPISLVLHMIFPTLIIICITLLSITKQYLSLYNKTILTKTRKTSLFYRWAILAGQIQTSRPTLSQICQNISGSFSSLFLMEKIFYI